MEALIAISLEVVPRLMTEFVEVIQVMMEVRCWEDGRE